MLITKEEVKREISELVVRAQTTLTTYKVHENHTPYSEVLRDQNVKSIIFLAVQVSILGGNAGNRKHFTYKKIKAAFKALGNGDIERFRDDLEDVFDKLTLSEFMTEVIYYLVKEKQHACARCGCKITNHTHGAWGFELDHVAENFRMEGKASTKTANVSDIQNLKGKLLEMTQCQLTCNMCHLNLSHNKTGEINKMVL